MSAKLANNAWGTLASSILANDVSLTLTAGQGARFPSPSGTTVFYGTLVDSSNNLEIVKCTARTTDTLTIARAQDGTTALPFAAGSRLEIRLTSAAWDAKMDADMTNVHAATSKASPVDADELSLWDSVTAGLNKLTIANLKALIFTAWGALIATGTNKATPVDADAFAMMDSAAANATKNVTWANFKATLKTYFDTLYGSGKNSYRVLNLLHPNNAYSVFKAGWRPAMFAQNAGIAANVPFILTDGATGVTSEFWAATGNVKDDSYYGVASAASGTLAATGFKVSESITLGALWLKLAKAGNPGNNLTCAIYADNGSGSPSTLITNGTATAQSGKLHTSDAGGAMYRFVFATPPALVAGTQYHIVLGSSGAVDASNYWNWHLTTSKTYPHGFFNTWNGSAWTQFTGYSACFLIEAPAANALVQSGGQFGNGKLAFAEGSPLDQSRGLIAKLTDLDFTQDEFTIRLNGTAFTKDKTIMDLLYGLDHDRVVLRCNVTSGFPQVDVYDSTGTKRTVTGSTDISTGNHDIVLHVRAKGDGADKVEMVVDGVAATPVTAASFTFARELQLLGHIWLGGGFAPAPTWTQKLNMTVLPSADTPAWTWTGTGTEANCMSVANGRLFQNKDGYAATDTGYYTKSASALSNANGWNVQWRNRTASATNTLVSNNYSGNCVAIQDGAKYVTVGINEYFTNIGGASVDTAVQSDFKSMESVFSLVGKGSDYYLFANGRLVVDGTSKFLSTTAANTVSFGDQLTTSGENADAVYDYVAYYNTAAILPQFTSGSISEFALFSGDQTGIAASLWNNGAPISVKQFCGVGRDWVKEVSWAETRKGITQNPTVSAGSTVSLPEQNAFVIGDTLEAFTEDSVYNSVTGNVTEGVYVDGVQNSVEITYTTTNYTTIRTTLPQKRFNFGLHSVDQRMYNGANTCTSAGAYRAMKVEAK